MRRILPVLAAALALATVSPAFAAEGEVHMEHQEWSFSGPFGRFEQAQLQRGFKVYREVCASCHSMNLLSFRNLGEKHGPWYMPEYPNANDNPYVKAIAAEAQVDVINTETGDTDKQAAVPADRFPAPYKNEYAARGGNGGAFPPDLSVIVKARHGGPDYIYSLMMGYVTPPAGTDVPAGMNYNNAFPGHLIAMKAPLADNKVTFDDGTQSTAENQARDVAAFLAWASDPRQTERKQTGIAVMIFLLILAGLAYFSYRSVWKNQH